MLIRAIAYNGLVYRAWIREFMIVSVCVKVLVSLAMLALYTESLSFAYNSFSYTIIRY